MRLGGFPGSKIGNKYENRVVNGGFNLVKLHQILVWTRRLGSRSRGNFFFSRRVEVVKNTQNGRKKRLLYRNQGDKADLRVIFEFWFLGSEKSWERVGPIFEEAITFLKSTLKKF